MSRNAGLFSERSWARQNGIWLGISLLLVLFALIGLWQTPDRIHRDCALHLQEALLLLDGAVPYRDFVDSAPPSVIYLNLAPAVAARTLGLSPIIAFGLAVIGLLVVSGLELDYLLRQRRLGLPAAGRGLVLLTWFALYFIVDWQGNTGHREHLFMLFYIPYLFLRVLRYRGGSVAGWFAVLLGVQAGVGAELKPLFLLVVVNVELILMFATHRRRMLYCPEVLALAAVAVGYLVHWLMVPSAMRTAFFERWQPLLSYAHHADDVGYLQVIETILASPVSLAAMASAVAAVMVCFQRRSRLRFHLIALAALTGMSLVLVLLQQKGWSYHCIPLNVAGMLCLAILVVEGSRMWTIGRRTAAVGVGQWAAGGAIFAVVVLIWFVIRATGGADRPEVASLREIIEQSTQPNDRVLVVATSADSAYPLLLQTGRRPGSRYLYSFPIRCVYATPSALNKEQPLYRHGNEAPIEERQFLADLDEDVIRRPPKLIVVEDRSKLVGLPDEFNTFDYLKYNGWVDKTLTLLYRQRPAPEGWKVFERSSTPPQNEKIVRAEVEKKR